MLVSVSAPAKLTKSASVRAVLNSAKVPSIPTIEVWSPVLVPETEASAPVTVNVLLVVPPAIVNPSASSVRAKLLMLVAVAAPISGVVSVGLVANTAKPVPVSSLKAAANPAEFTSNGSFSVSSSLIAA